MSPLNLALAPCLLLRENMDMTTDSLFHRLQTLAARAPHSAVTTIEDRELTRAQFLDETLKLVEWLTQQGLRAGERVLYWGKNDPLMLMLPFACSQLDLTLVPVSDLHAKSTAKHVAMALDVSLVIGKEDIEGVRNLNIAQVKSELRRLKTSAPSANASSQTTARIIFLTSGSTGVFKAIAISESHLLANIDAAIAGQSLSDQDVVLLNLSLCHSGGLCIQTLPAILAGAYVTLGKGFTPKGLAEAFAVDQKPTVTLTVPSQLRMLKMSLAWDKVMLDQMRLIGIGSAPLMPTLAVASLDRGLKLMNIYGLTEAGPYAIAGWISGKSVQGAVNLGTATRGMEVRLEQRDHGEILLRGPAVQASILEAKSGGGEIRRLSGPEGWFRTGDYGFKQGDSFYFNGRLSEIINVGGMKVDPVEVENVLMEMPGVAACAVVSREHSLLGESLVACIEPAPQTTLSRQSVLKHCLLTLSRYKVPREIKIFDKLPRSAIGKILKGELRKIVA